MLSTHSNRDADVITLQAQMTAMRAEIARLTSNQLEKCESVDAAGEFLLAQARRTPRRKIPRNVSKLRRFVRAKTLRCLDDELRKPKTPLYKRAWKKS